MDNKTKSRRLLGALKELEKLGVDMTVVEGQQVTIRYAIQSAIGELTPEVHTHGWDWVNGFENNAV